jgi:quercetin dioxygenase-like cupin family protein
MWKTSIAAIAASYLSLLHVSALLAQEVSYQSLVTPVLSASQTVIGEPLAYPSGKAVVTAVVVTVPPGGETGWHRHPVPLFGYILEGSLEVDYGPHGKRSYKSGDGLLEAMGAPHNGRNLGAVPVRILAVYVGADGVANAAVAK